MNEPLGRKCIPPSRRYKRGARLTGVSDWRDAIFRVFVYLRPCCTALFYVLATTRFLRGSGQLRTAPRNRNSSKNSSGLTPRLRGARREAESPYEQALKWQAQSRSSPE